MDAARSGVLVVWILLLLRIVACGITGSVPWRGGGVQQRWSSIRAAWRQRGGCVEEAWGRRQGSMEGAASERCSDAALLSRITLSHDKSQPCGYFGGLHPAAEPYRDNAWYSQMRDVESYKLLSLEQAHP